MKNIFNYVLISISTILVGFTAMALPFKLFNELSKTEMRVLFLAEVIIYFSIFSLYFIIKENKKENKRKEQKLQEMHNVRVIKREKELQGINLSNFDLVA